MNTFGSGGAALQQSPPPVLALQSILHRIQEIRNSLVDLHGIADRACGDRGPAGQTALTAAPNGMIDEIDHALNDLAQLSSEAVARLSRIA